MAVLGAWPASAQQAARVIVDTVREEPLRQKVPVIGRLVAERSGVVAARSRGAVENILVDVGDRLNKDDVIAVLANDRLASERDLRAAQVAAAEAALATADAEYRLRRQELGRLQGLQKSPAFSKGGFDDKRLEVTMSKGDLSRAEAALASARAELQLAEINLRDTEIRAPYAGVVTQRHTEIGAYLDIGDPVVNLVDDRNLEIEADVPAERIGGLAAGTTVGFELNERQLEAKVRAIVPQENPLTRTRTVRFVPDFQDLSDLAANESVVVQVPAGKSRTVVSVHKDAILDRKGKTMVVVVVDDKAEIRPVRIGEAIGGRFEVLDFLKPGDIVVVRGNERLRPGQKVTYLQGNEG